MSVRERGEGNPRQQVNLAGQRVKTCRRLAAGEARRGGALRKSPTGHQLMRGEQLRVAGNEPRCLVVVGGLGVAGNVAGDEPCGRRSRAKVSPRLRGTARRVVRCVVPLGMQ